MKGRLFCLLLTLCLLLGASALALAEEKLPPCGNPEHSLSDGMDHRRPDPCWVYGHFNCDGRDHNRASCRIGGHYGCDGRDHGLAVCGVEGHYACVPGTHATPVCGISGHCIRDKKQHVKAGCGIEGHYVCDGQKHTAASCGVYGHRNCDGEDHTRAACRVYGHTNCDGLEHALAACGISGHCVSDGKTHEGAPCGYDGHLLCDGRKHVPAACGIAGHYACEARAHKDKVLSKYCNAVPQHRVCEGNPEHYCDPAQGGCGRVYRCTNSNAHTACRMCGLLWCDRTLGGHETPCMVAEHRPCVYRLNGERYVRAEHELCPLCGNGFCDGRKHGNKRCVRACENCGRPEVYGQKHMAECGRHFSCDGAKHDWCSECGMPRCAEACTH